MLKQLYEIGHRIQTGHGFISCLLSPNFIELTLAQKVAKRNKNYTYQNKVSSQLTMSQVHYVTDIVLISSKQKIAKHYFLLKHFYEFEPW